MAESYHSPLSTTNGSEYPFSYISQEQNNLNLKPIKSPKRRNSDHIQQFYRKSNAVTFGAERRRSAHVQQFYKVTTMKAKRYSFADRYSYDTNKNKQDSQKQFNGNNNLMISMPSDDNDTFSPSIPPLTPILSNHDSLNIKDSNDQKTKRNRSKSAIIIQN